MALDHPQQISIFSTVSRQWVHRTQFHKFWVLPILSQQHLDKWRATITPDPSGISRYVKTIVMCKVDTLNGFEDHLRAFTRLTVAHFDNCGIFLSWNNTSALTSLGSNLFSLILKGLVVSPDVMAQLLSSLPRLRHINAIHTTTDSRNVAQVSHASIPFFQSPNNLVYGLATVGPSRAPEWIPPTARFQRLVIGHQVFHDNPGTVNGWIASSRDSLTDFYIEPNSHIYSA